MRFNFGLTSIAVLTLAGGCWSEATLDNYHDSWGSGGRGDTNGRNSTTSLIPPFPGNNLGSGVGLGFGYLALPGALGLGAAGASGDLGKAQYHVTGYWQSGSQGRLEFGVSNTDHVVILFEATCSGPDRLSQCLGLIELTASGDELRFVQFPSATMPEVVHVTPTGEVVMAGKLKRPIAFGAEPIHAVEHGFYVAKLDRDWRQQFAFGVNTDGDSTLNDIALGLEDVVYIAVSETASDGLRTSDLLLAYRPDGSEMRRWHAFPIARLAGTESGSVLAAGWRLGTTEIGGISLAPAQGRDGVLFSFDATSGGTTPILSFGGMTDDEITAFTQTPSGEIRLGGRVSRGEASFSADWDLAAKPKPFLAQVNQAAQVTDAAPLDESGCISDLVQRGDAAFFAGYTVPDEPNVAAKSRLFLGALSSKGEPEVILAFDGQLSTLGRIGMDSKGTIWLSGCGQISTTNVVSAVYRIEQR